MQVFIAFVLKYLQLACNSNLQEVSLCIKRILMNCLLFLTTTIAAALYVSTYDLPRAMSTCTASESGPWVMYDMGDDPDGGATYRSHGDSVWSEAIDGRRDWIRLDTLGKPAWVLRENSLTRWTPSIGVPTAALFTNGEDISGNLSTEYLMCRAAEGRFFDKLNGIHSTGRQHRGTLILGADSVETIMRHVHWCETDSSGQSSRISRYRWYPSGGGFPIAVMNIYSRNDSIGSTISSITTAYAIGNDKLAEITKDFQNSTITTPPTVTVESGNIVVTPGSDMNVFKVDLTDMNGQAYVSGLNGTPGEPLVIPGADLPRGRYVVQVTAGDREFKLYVKL